MTNEHRFESNPVNMVTYVYPRISRLEHSDCETESDNILVNCPRSGGGILTVTGTDFGLDGAVILVGASICEISNHVSDTEVQCVLPAGFQMNIGVIFIQSGGATSNDDAFVSWVPCPGNAENFNGSCQCNFNYFNMSREQFSQVYPEDFTTYSAIYSDTSNLFNLWCGEAPLGGDASQRGSSAQTIQPLYGYTHGLSKSGLYFPECLHSCPDVCETTDCCACMGGLGCEGNYTGTFCMECVDPYVLQVMDCTECMDISIYVAGTIIGFLIACGVLAFYVNKSTSSVKTVSDSQIWFKIVTGTLQINAAALSFSFNWTGIVENMLGVQAQVASVGMFK